MLPGQRIQFKLNRVARIRVLALLGALGILAGAAYLYCRPRIRLATANELRAVSPPELLVRPTADAAAQRRYGELVSLCKLMRKPESIYTGSPDIYDRNKLIPLRRQLMRVNEKLVLAAMRVLARGPIQRPYSDDPWAPTLDYPAIKQFAQILSYQADLAGRDGNKAACGNAVLNNLRLSTAFRAATGPLMFYLVAAGIDSTADRSALFCARKGWLSSRSMREIIRQIPLIGAVDLNFRDALVQEFQQSLGGDLDVVRGMKKEMSQGSTDEPPGSFDVIETARLQVRYFTALRNNARRDWRHQDLVPAQIEKEAGAGIPEDPDPTSIWRRLEVSDLADNLGDGEPEKPPMWEKWFYAFRMNTIPNSLGRLIFSGSDISEEAMATSVSESTRHEILKAIVALRLYALDHGGKLPSTLEPVVREGYLSSIPMDWFASAPLRYDPRRRIVYSVGADGNDDKGTFEKEFHPSEPDFGAFIDQPTESSGPGSATGARKGSSPASASGE